jgi:glucokinase
MTAPRDSDVWTIGIDVGGTKIAAGLVCFPKGQVHERSVILTRPERGSDAVLADVINLVGKFYEQARSQSRSVLGLGIGVPELVDLEGHITSATTIDWRDVETSRFNPWGPVSVDADVRTAALGEALFGAGKGYRLFVYVNVGTGISCCLVQDGRPFPGARGNALVLGSGPEIGFCTECKSRIETVLEDYASGPGIVRQYLSLSGASNAMRADDILAATVANEPMAEQIVTRAAAALGNRVGWLVNVLDPEAVIVGGGVGLAGGLYWQVFQQAARSAIWDASTRCLPILKAALSVDAGLVGAASIAYLPRPR